MDYRLSKIINIVRSLNEEMVGNGVGQSGGFGQNSPATGPTAGFDSVMKGPIRRRTVLAKGKLPGMRTRFKKGADFITNLKKNK